MPLQPKYQKILDEMISKHGAEKGKQMFWAWASKNDIQPDLKAYSFYSGELKALEDDIVEGYISTGSKDLANDIVTQNCMKSMLAQMQNRTITLDVEHETFKGRTPAEKSMNKALIPVAKIVDASYDGKGIHVKTKLNTHNSRYEEVKGSIKDGFLHSFSIAYIPTKPYFKSMNGAMVRMLDDVNLLNVTYTGVPINPEAEFDKIMLKSISESLEFDEKEVAEILGGILMAEEVKTEAPLENLEVKSLGEQFKAMSATVAELKASLEGKIQENAEMKSADMKKSEELVGLKAQVNTLTEQVKAMDVVLSKPQFKANMEQMDQKLKETEVKAAALKGPVDLIN